ncbi:TMEM43 family protein [Oryzibacter oryziterrae]|uniref:TMEM43 family protein n=1 Tax=Oryzibacter oryziterrae TaxID=2766474 RepID=UPI001F19C33F|nr:TMEM43 family protein [Oryzibacter oryziterrae]
MSNDRIVEVTQTSWLSRIKNALAGIVIGLILIPVSLGVMFWNEGRAVVTARSLAEGRGLVVSVDSAKVDPANEGHLIHITGPVKGVGTPEDQFLGVSADGLRIERKVEMYQWKEDSHSETQKKLGGGEETTTVYTYTKVWTDEALDSSSFKEPDGHQNPPKPVGNETFSVDEGSLGAFQLTSDQLGYFGKSEPLVLPSDKADDMRERLGTDKAARIAGGKLLVGFSADAPMVGDLRISYVVVKPDVGSLVAAQKGEGVAPYRTEAGNDLFLTDNGNVSADDMFAEAVTANTIITWLIRAGGFLLLFIGFRLILGVISVLADVVPFIGSIVSFGLGIIAFVPTLLLGATTIAIAWLYYRPLVAIAVIAVAVLATVGALYLRRKPAVKVA